MKAKEIHNMTPVEINQKLLDFKEQQFNIRAEATSGKVQRPSRIKFLRRDIARCYTILNEKEAKNGEK
ncbi:MAG: 50S ribosomal protein L29 [Candidatus Omnitrophota bacterium]